MRLRCGGNAGNRVGRYHSAGDGAAGGNFRSAPGESAYAQLRFTEDVAAKCGDRFVIRFYSPLETVGGGDLSATIQRISGYTPDNLTVMETAQNGAKRYDFVWASAGENGDQLGRAVILDDGNYHYCLSVLRDADTTEKSQIVWRDVFDSFKLI